MNFFLISKNSSLNKMYKSLCTCSLLREIGLDSTTSEQNDFFSSLFQIDISRSVKYYVTRSGHTICDYKIITFSELINSHKL